MDIALIVTVVLAFVGYIVKYYFDKINYRREKKLELINQRLNLFYGPLYFQTIAGKEIDAELRKKFKVPDGANVLEEQYFDEWRLFVNEVLMPLNLMREKIILENSYLIIENDPPESLKNFIIHVSTLKAVVAKWKSGDFSENFAMVPFPPDLGDYIINSYLNLKRKQSELVGK
jgi:hypothetical protein